MSLTHDDVTRILKIIDSLEGRDVHIEYGDLKIHVSRSGAPAPAAPPVAAAPAQPAAMPAASPAPVAARPAAPSPAPAAAAAAPAPAAEVAVPPGHVAVRAPMVGTFYRAPSPGAPPFVEVGARVGPDDTLCLLEVMKLFNSIKAGVAGTVAQILVDNAQLVAHNQVMILIDTHG